MQEEYLDKKKKLYMCFVAMEKAFDIAPKKVMEWAIRKKGILAKMVRAMMNLYQRVKMKVKVRTKLPEEFLVKIGEHQESVLSPIVVCNCGGCDNTKRNQKKMNEICMQMTLF